MNRQIIDNIKSLLTDLSIEFDNYIKDSSSFANRITISVTEQQATENEKLKELKLDLIENELSINTDKTNIAIKNLNFFNNYLSNIEIKQLIDKLIDLNKHYLELDEIWKTIDWRYFYDVFNNQLFIYSKKRSLLKSINISEIKNIPITLNEYLTEKTRRDFEKLFTKTLKLLKIEIQTLLNHLDFIDLFFQLHKEITDSLTKSLEIQWNEFVSKTELLKSDIVLLAFILRLSIEAQLKNHPIILADTSPIKMLGNIIKKLQNNGVFATEKDEIERYLQPLNKVAHAEIVSLTKSDLLITKEYFKSLLATQNLNLF